MLSYGRTDTNEATLPDVDQSPYQTHTYGHGAANLATPTHMLYHPDLLSISPEPTRDESSQSRHPAFAYPDVINTSRLNATTTMSRSLGCHQQGMPALDDASPTNWYLGSQDQLGDRRSASFFGRNRDKWSTHDVIASRLTLKIAIYGTYCKSDNSITVKSRIYYPIISQCNYTAGHPVPKNHQMREAAESWLKSQHDSGRLRTTMLTSGKELYRRENREKDSAHTRNMAGYLDALFLERQKQGDFPHVAMCPAVSSESVRSTAAPASGLVKKVPVDLVFRQCTQDPDNAADHDATQFITRAFHFTPGEREAVKKVISSETYTPSEPCENDSYHGMLFGDVDLWGWKAAKDRLSAAV